MPKQAATEPVIIPGHSAAEFWDKVFVETKPTVEYHARCNSSSDTKVGGWSADQREVTFTTTVPLFPSIIRDQIKYWCPAFNWDRVPVREVQRVTWQGAPGRSSFVISSKPEVSDASIGSIVTTDLELVVTEVPHHEDGAHADAGAGSHVDAGAVEAAAAGQAAAPPRPSPSASCGDLQLQYRVTCTANTRTWVGSCVPGLEDASVARALESMNGFLKHCKETLAGPK